MYFVQHVEIKAKSKYVCLVMYNSNYNLYIYIAYKMYYLISHTLTLVIKESNEGNVIVVHIFLLSCP